MFLMLNLSNNFPEADNSIAIMQGTKNMAVARVKEARSKPVRISIRLFFLSPIKNNVQKKKKKASDIGTPKNKMEGKEI